MSTVPFAIPPHRFPFPALARRAARAAIGDGREVAVACLMAARLALSLLPPLSLPAAARADRAALTRTWLASLALPIAVRTPLTRLADATARDVSHTASALRDLASAASAALDAASRAELVALADALASADRAAPPGSGERGSVRAQSGRRRGV